MQHDESHPPKKFSTSWGHQPVHLFFDPPFMYHPYAEHAHRGDAWFEKGECGRAYEEYATAIKKCRNQDRVHGVMSFLIYPSPGAVLGMMFGKPSDIQVCFLFSRMSLAALMMGEYGRCLDDARSAIKQCKTVAPAYFIGAMASVAMGDASEARRQYEQALVYDPTIDEVA